MILSMILWFPLNLSSATPFSTLQSLMNLFALLLVSNAYRLHFIIINFKVLYELNPLLTIMTWRFNDHGFK